MIIGYLMPGKTESIKKEQRTRAELYQEQEYVRECECAKSGECQSQKKKDVLKKCVGYVESESVQESTGIHLWSYKFRFPGHITI